MTMMKTCLNWKVLVGLAVVGVGTYLIAPELVVAVVPFLLLAACPLSMMFMMLAMRRDRDGDKRAPREDHAGLSREERLVRLRWQHATLAEQIDELERGGSSPPSDNGRS